MREGYDVLGKYISLVDERNRELSITNLLGVSIEKRFIPSIANIVGTDLSSYKIVRTGQFAYGPVTSRNGEKISIALLSGEDCIISSSYTVFEIKDKNHLDAEYLMLWFMRPEFDRYARFKSHGSVREAMDWDELEIGVTMDTAPAIESLTQLMIQAGMSADAIQDTLNSLGWEADLITTKGPNGEQIVTGVRSKNSHYIGSNRRGLNTNTKKDNLILEILKYQ